MYPSYKVMTASLGLALMLGACDRAGSPSLTASGLDPQRFVAEVEGKETGLYTLTNDNGMEVTITNFGGRVVSVMVPDRDGTLRDVVLGFDNIDDYLNQSSDFGASVGRYANRIDHGVCPINGDTVQLPVNNILDAEGNFVHHLHGGPTGWQYQVYSVVSHDPSQLVLAMDSPDGDNNFPGNVHAEVTFTLTADNALDIAYSATTDKATVINMTNHSYFNLSGDPAKPVTDHMVALNASQYTPVDATYMTTGEIVPVEGTPLDFTSAKLIGQDIAAEHDQITYGNGYDHNWVLDAAGDIDTVSAVAWCPETGIRLEVRTTEPGLQFYTGNFLDGSAIGKKGIAYQQRTGFCMETQHYPDSPNKPEWPSTVVNPGDTYSSRCIYSFSIID